MYSFTRGDADRKSAFGKKFISKHEIYYFTLHPLYFQSIIQFGTVVKLFDRLQTPPIKMCTNIDVGCCIRKS